MRSRYSPWNNSYETVVDGRRYSVHAHFLTDEILMVKRAVRHKSPQAYPRMACCWESWKGQEPTGAVAAAIAAVKPRIEEQRKALRAKQSSPLFRRARAP
jgi:hypothetical protein